MKRRFKIGSAVVLIVRYFYIILFVYAATSKLLDYENFRIQLAQSPLLAAFADWVSVFVPLLEIVIAFLLMITRLKNIGLYAAYTLMVMFTVYIYLTLHYSAFIPCSCGGILEKLGWDEHLWFNLIFVTLGLVAILFSQKENPNMLSRLIVIAACSIFGVGATALLFVFSEDIMINSNPFIRRFPPHPVEYSKQTSLQLNSYYIAGYGNGKVYLGNYTSPLRVLEIDTSFMTRREHKLILDFEGNMKAPRLVVDGQSFYIADGTMPYIATGSTTDWRGEVLIKDKPYFTIAMQAGLDKFFFRGISSGTGENVLGFTTPHTVQLAPSLLQKRLGGDGVFDTDGHLAYSSKLSRLVYVYAYRNQFVVADDNLKLSYTGRTIDTVSSANIQTIKRKDGSTTLAAPPLLVNGGAAVVDDLLFVDGRLRGKYESEAVWRRSTTIDVYDLNRNRYVMSFYLPDIGRHKLHSFHVTSTNVYVITNDQLTAYEIKGVLKEELKRAKDTDSLVKHTGQYQGMIENLK